MTASRRPFSGPELWPLRDDFSQERNKCRGSHREELVDVVVHGDVAAARLDEDVEPLLARRVHQQHAQDLGEGAAGARMRALWLALTRGKESFGRVLRWLRR